MEKKLKRKNTRSLSNKEVQTSKNGVCLNDLVDNIYSKCNNDPNTTDNFTKKQIKYIIDEFITSISHFLSQDIQVFISGFLRFCIKHAGPKTLKNPKTNETIDIPSHTKLSVKACAAIKNLCKKPVKG